MKVNTIFIKKSILSIFLTILAFSFANAQEEIPAEPEGEHFSVHHAAIFLGMTTNKTNDFTLGLDYAYKLPYYDYQFGVGVFIEGVFAEHKESILGFPIFYNTGLGELKLWMAPAVEFGDEAKEGTENTHGEENGLPSAPDETEFQTHFLFRMGVGYDIHIGMFSLSPAISIDFVNEQTAWVYGLGLGMSF